MHGENLVIIIAMSRLFLISKEEAFHICDKSQYRESSLGEKLKLTFRYLWCRTTRLYVNRNKKLTKAIKSSNLECLKYSERQLLHDQLKKHLDN